MGTRNELISVDPDFPDYPKTKKLVELLKDEKAPWLLIRLWGKCKKQKTGAFAFSEITPDSIKEICRYDGNGEKLIDALIQSGFAYFKDDKFIVHQWDEYNAVVLGAGFSAVSMIPENLKTPEFLATWNEWESYRRQRRNSLTPISAKKQLKMLEAIGPTMGILSIEESMRCGWQGLFELKGVAKKMHSKSARDWTYGAVAPQTA